MHIYQSEARTLSWFNFHINLADFAALIFMPHSSLYGSE
uniref:Uncharacterized protein n=1 Tax=Rhizophora mucronata TaxID=61149 RepID=A0A2P2PB77_RHIMU